MTVSRCFHNQLDISMLAILFLVTTAGCRQERTVAAGRAKPKPVQSRQLTTRSPSTNGHDYTQVSLFGELPKAEQSDRKFQANKSLQQHTFGADGACFDPVICPEGKLLAFATTQYQLKADIYIKPVAGSTMTQLTSDPASDVQPCFSPDGRRIAFCSQRTGNWDIFVTDVTGGNVQQLTDDPAAEMHPSFSPDGRSLAYCRYNRRSGQWEIWVLELSGAGRRQFVTTGLFPTYSPIGSRIVYQRARQRGSRWFSIWQIDLADGKATMPTEIARSPDRALICPRWSWDGRHIVYCAVAAQEDQPGHAVTSEAQIWIIGSDGTGKMPVTEPGAGCFSPAWSRSGRIFFCANRGASENIWSVLPIIDGTTLPGPGAGEAEGSAKANEPVALGLAKDADEGH